MRHPFRTLALACALFLAACSGGDASSEPNANQIGTTANPLIYEISSADGGVEGWLLGTIHALPDGVEWRTPALEEVVLTADLLLVEIADVTDRNSNAETFQRLATTQGLDPLWMRVDPELRRPLDTLVNLSEIPPERFRSIEDWAAAIMLSRADALGSPQNGVDRAVIGEFQDREVRGLETTASQLAIFDDLSSDDQRDLLEGTVREWTASRDNPGWLIQAWATGDETVLEEATSTGILADAGLREALLVGRNRNWVAQLETDLALQPRPLIAVGAAHLVGPDGLAAMLEARGYTVRRME